MAAVSSHFPNRYNDEDDTQNTSASHPISDISALSGSSMDDLDRAIHNYARDRQRLDHATAAPAFSKARPRPSLALTMENLERNNPNRRQTSAGSTASSGDVRPSVSAAAPVHRSMSDGAAMHGARLSMDDSELSSPSHNVPQQWGRKGVRKNDFLRRISAVSSPVKFEPEEDEKVDPDRILRRRTILTGDSPRSDVWTDSREAALEALEGRSGDSRTRSHEMEQEHTNSSIDEILEREREEVLDPSSPTSKISGKRALSGQSFSKEEVADLGTRGITTSRLSALAPSLLRRRQPGSRASAASQLDGEDAREGQSGSVLALKSHKPLTASRREIRDLANGHRTGDLLKKLASASSSSTSSRANGRDKLPPTRDTVSSLNKRVRNQEDSQTGTSSSPRNSLYRRSVSPEQISARGPSRADSAIVRTTPEAHDEVDDDADDRDDLRENGQDHDQLSTIPSVPSHPHSAAEELLQDPEGHALGDSTIHSLQDLLDEHPDVDLSTVLPLDDETLILADGVNEPVTPIPASERQEEIIALRRMSDRFKVARSGLLDEAARAGLIDASRGSQQVDHQAEEVDADVDVEVRTKKVVPKAKSSPTSVKQGVCEHCGREDVTLGKLVRRAWRDFLDNFYIWPRNGRLRFTWLGLLFLTFMIWWFTEVTLCEQYCHKLYGRTMRGYGVDIYAPRKPLVTYTILFKRPFLALLKYLSWITGWDELFAEPRTGFDAGFQGQEHDWRPPADVAFGEDEHL